jgi:sugar lactone lactonase YvrE/enterochelin esterase-like enzyme
MIKKSWLLVFPLMLCSLIYAEGPYPIDEAAVVHEGVPKGIITKYHFSNSKIFPGTERYYWIYVPAQYDAAKPASLMVFQDGEGYMNPNGPDKATVVFDNLIHQKEMPVTIGLFINPGVVPALQENAQPRFNRSYEYDAFSGDYARFLIDEILPEVSKNYQISANPDDRGLCGASSGGIAAFTAAWHRPDAFRRVYSMIGTYVGLRDGEQISTLIRKTEPKPLRIFLQDGSNDNNIYCGDWWMANQMMERSLVFSGYQVAHEWGEGPHSHQHGGSLLAKAMRWLWQDAGKPLNAIYDKCSSKAKDMLIAGENWQLVGEGYGFTEGPVCAKDQSLYFSDIPKNQIWKRSADGKLEVFLNDTKATNGLAIGPDGRLYGCRAGSKQIVSWDLTTKQVIVHATGIEGNDLIVAHDTTIYVTEPKKHAVWYIKPGQPQKLGSDQFHGVNGITLTPDQSRVEVADPSGRFVYSCTRQLDGGLTFVQPYHHLHLPLAEEDPRSSADGMAVARDGWLFVATALGVQVSDQPGRVNLILTMPQGVRYPSNLCFGGADGKTLYATCGDKVYQRKINLAGVFAWESPIKPPKPGL